MANLPRNTQTCKAISTENFAAVLIKRAGGRKVIDKTGLTGLYDIQISYSAASAALNQEFPLPDIFTALQEQLGLKLEKTKAPMDYFIIDDVEKPSEN